MKISILSFLALLIMTSAKAKNLKLFENMIMPFSTDGCSRFPDSFAGVSWRHCCVQHDYQYWKGGTSDERSNSDLELKECVKKNAGAGLGILMQAGVNLTGSARLPTSWRWGFGWVIDRGYKKISLFEQNKIDKLTPRHLDEVKIILRPVIPLRKSISGNYCYDIALFEIASSEGRNRLHYEVLEDVATKSPYRLGKHVLRSIKILIDKCPIAYEATFLLDEVDSCKISTLEVNARKNIELVSVTSGCEFY